MSLWSTRGRRLLLSAALLIAGIALQVAGLGRPFDAIGVALVVLALLIPLREFMR